MLKKFGFSDLFHTFVNHKHFILWFTKKSNENTMNRRDFLFRLGIGTPLAITGFFAVDTIMSADTGKSPQLSKSSSSEFPELSVTVKKEFKDDKLVLSGGNIKCFVNKTGEKIIEFMDGKNKLPDICSCISDYYSIEYTDALQESVAKFICQLGEAGLLSSPFYVTMYETY
jgi:hypothetical protein